MFPLNWSDISDEAKTMWKQAIDEVKGPVDKYEKKVTPVYNDLQDVAFVTKDFKKIKGIRYKKAYNLLDNDE